jgi:hypothetical protein
MNYSDSIKAILLAAINELSKIPENYAVKPGVDFIRNRKLGFKDYMLMFLTMEADCIREELYRFFGRTTDAPSKAAFYKQRKKSKKTLFGTFFLLLTENFLESFITVNMNSGPAMVLPVIFSLTLRIRIPILSLMVNLPEALIRSISMPCFPCLTSALLIS